MDLRVRLARSKVQIWLGLLFVRKLHFAAYHAEQVHVLFFPEDSYKFFEH